MFENAWTYTENRAFFSLVSDELLSRLMGSLNATEKEQLVSMLHKVAGACDEPGEIRRSSIARFKKHLLM